MPLLKTKGRALPSAANKSVAWPATTRSCKVGEPNGRGLNYFLTLARPPFP